VSRIARLVELARASRSFERTTVDGRDALSIVGDDGRQISFLRADEVIAFRAALVAPPEVWTIEGLPACQWDARRGEATGRDDGARIELTIVGTRDQLTPAVASQLTAAYADIVRRRDQLASDISTRLVSLYNDTWRDGPVLAVAAIAKRLRLTDVDFSIEDGPPDPTLWFDDGGLFAGHLIEVRLDATGAIASCSVVG
jgi:hypothetical protein